MRRHALTDLGGFITERGAEKMTVRLRIPAGIITPDQMEGIAAIARRYQAGIHLTTRQTIELSHIDPAHAEMLVADLSANRTPLGAEKAEVVNITACPGLDRCKYAQIDSISLALALDQDHFGKDMPVKCRIAVSSCPFSCTSEHLCEIGVTGVVIPYRTPGTCTGCDSCVQYCPEHAITLVNGNIRMDMDLCSFCGMCIPGCPYGIISADSPSYRITIGGRRGKHPRKGIHLITVRSDHTARQVVGEVVTWIYRSAWGGSLLSDQLGDLDVHKLADHVRTGIPPEEIVE